MKEDEFARIIRFFSLNAEEKAQHLNDVFEDSIEFFERFKYVIQHGSPEEKKEMLEKVNEMQKKLQDETKQICETTGLSEEDLTQFSNDPSNFTKEQWESILQAKDTIAEQSEEIANLVKFKDEPPKPSSQKKKKKKTKSSWVKS